MIGRSRLLLAGAIVLLGSCVGPALRAPVRLQGAAALLAPVQPVRVDAPLAATLPPAPAVTPMAAPRSAGPFALTGRLRQGGVAIGRAPAGTVSLALDGMAVPVAPDSRFLIAFDRDAQPVVRLAATLADGRTIAEALAIAPGNWRIERVDAPLRAGRTTEEFARRRPAELAAIAAARAIDGGAQGWRQRFVWPVRGRRSGQFGAQRVYRGEPGSFHSGTDVAAPAGAAIVAPADGVVVLATDAPFTLEGNLVILDHGMGLNSAFLHLSSIAVAKGQMVRQGQPIGRVGATGRATGPHMHWGMKWRTARIDPAPLAGPMD